MNAQIQTEFTAEEIHIIREVVYFFRSDAPGAIQPGTFTMSLLRAFAHADNNNLALLTQAYPQYGRAMRMALQGHEGGIDRMMELIG